MQSEIIKTVNLPIPPLKYYNNEKLLIDTTKVPAETRKFND